MQLDVIDRKDSTKILWSETKVVPEKYLEEINRILGTAKHITSTEPFCFDGMYIIGIFENDTLQYKFVCHCPFEELQYVFVKQTIKTMLKILKNRKSMRYVRVIREYQ